MSTEETSTEETPSEETKDGLTMLELEQKIVRFNNLRNILVQKDQEWVEAHTAKRKELLEKAGILEEFLAFDAELMEHRKGLEANIKPITACITVLSEYRMACVQRTPFGNMDALEKVWTFEDQLFALQSKSEETEEKNGENSEE